MNKNTGGPAFPVIAENGLGHVCDGMTLRDYFAAKAMQSAVLACNKSGRSIGANENMESIAAIAYGIADAMLNAMES